MPRTSGDYSRFTTEKRGRYEGSVRDDYSSKVRFIALYRHHVPLSPG